jgi:pyruvate dehydrogenase E2 component (dihydrolipoamide acetyltransferase)
MEIETDKATVEIEATAAGRLAGVLYQESDEVPVGQTMAWILAPGESLPEGAAEGSEAVEAASAETAVKTPIVSPVAKKVAEQHGVDLALVKPSGTRIQKGDVLAYLDAQEGSGSAGLTPASPKARRLSRERGIELSDIAGSGPGGAVLAADLFGAEIAPGPSAATESLSSIWMRMAEQVTHSWTTAPHFYLLREVNASSLISWREYLKDSTGKRVTFTDLLVKVVAAALHKHPQVNNSWGDGVIIRNQEVNIGLAVAVEDGLIVPVIHNADKLTIKEIADRRAEIVERSQKKKMLLDDLQGGTFTISNLGMYGVDIFNAIVNPPQAAILAVGRITDRVVPVGGQPGIQPMMVLSISYDHRVIDGARGAQFLETLANFIEEPHRLIE